MFLRSTAGCAVSLLLLLLTARAAADGQQSAPPRPNIVVLVADDLGYGELGCQGNPQIPTPHIDSIAAAGVRFTDGYVTAPYCSASRAGLLTGRYQTRFGYEFNPVGHHNDDPHISLPAGEVTLAELLRDAGYATGIIGKWHLGGSSAASPLRHGFDHFFGFTHEGHYYQPAPGNGLTTMLRRKRLPDGGQGRWRSRDGRLVLSTHMGHHEPAYDANNPILRNGQPVVEPDYLTDALTREATSWIRQHSERPFFLYLAWNAVHSPLQARDEDLQRLASIPDVHRRIFAGMLLRLDDSVGQVLTTLRQQGLERQTLVVFISDNGGPTRELTSGNGPLRGEKGMVYEGGLRVPFLMRWPGRIPAGSVFRQPVTSLDIYGTSAAAAGIRRLSAIDGVDLLPFLTGQRSDAPHEALFWRLNQRRALRMGDWKLVRQPGRRQQGRWELYNLASDPGETTDRAQDEPARFSQLLSRWQAIDAEMAEPFWQPANR